MRAVALTAASVLMLVSVPSLAQSPRQSQQQGHRGVPSEITEANHRFEQAFNRGDAAAVAALYTEAATVLPPGADMQSGRQAIQSFWQHAYQSGLRNLSLNPISFETYGGDAGREIGHFTADASGQGGQTSRIEGKYVVVWKRTGDGWRLDTDIWNSSH